MTRAKKVNRFLLGGSLLVGGILTFIAGPILKYIIGGILILFGVISLSDRSNRMPAMISLVLGALFISANLGIPILGGLASSSISLLGILSIASGGYISYSAYKKINSY